MRIGIQIPAINTFGRAVWGDEVMAVCLARILSEQPGVSFAEVYDPVTIHSNLDVVLDLYPFPLLRHMRGPRYYWWYQAEVAPQVLAHPDWVKCLAMYDGFFAASPKLKNHLVELGIPAANIAVMPMSCDLDVYRRRAPVEKYALPVVFCGNGSIRPAATVARYLLPLKPLGLKVFGSNWQMHPQLQDCVVAPIAPPEVPELYSSCKVVLSTHTAWHFQHDLPTSRLWEALACGAVVVSDRIPFAEFLFGDAVVWTEGYQDIEAKVARLLADEEAREQIRGRGRRIIERELSFQAYAPRLLRIFRTGCMEEFLSSQGDSIAGDFVQPADDTTASLHDEQSEARDWQHMAHDWRPSFPQNSLRGETEQQKEPSMTNVYHPEESTYRHQQGDMFQEAESAPDWVARGEAAFGAGNLPEARQCFEKALRLAPFDAKIHNNMSVLYWREGNTGEALDSLTRALELDPDDQDVVLNCIKVFNSLGKRDDVRDIIEAYLQRKPWDYEVKRELEKLDASPREVPSPQQDVADFFNEQGERRFEAGKLEHARACFEMAVEHNPRHAKAHSNFAVMLLREGNLAGALDHLRQALDLNSEDPDILYNTGKVLAAAGQLETAADYLRLYLQRNPGDTAAWGDYAALVRQMSTAEWKPEGLPGEVAEVYAEMGKRLVQSGDFVGASQSFGRALQLNARLAEPYHQLARLHFELGQTSEALEILQVGLELGGEQAGSIIEVGGALAAGGKRREARELYQAYLRKHHDVNVQQALAELTAADTMDRDSGELTRIGAVD